MLWINPAYSLELQLIELHIHESHLLVETVETDLLHGVQEVEYSVQRLQNCGNLEPTSISVVRNNARGVGLVAAEDVVEDVLVGHGADVAEELFVADGLLAVDLHYCDLRLYR